MWCYLVQHLVKLAELGYFLHHLLTHEVRGVDRLVVFLMECAQTKLNQRLLQEYSPSLQGTREGGEGEGGRRGRGRGREGGGREGRGRGRGSERGVGEGSRDRGSEGGQGG